MHILGRVGARPLGLAAAAALAAGLVTVGPAVAPAGALQNAGSAFVANNTLTITGTNNADDITIAVEPASPNSVDVVFANDPHIRTFDVTTFNTVNVVLGNGDDKFTSQPGALPATEILNVQGGNGNDSITTSETNDLIDGGNGNDTMKSGAGTDLVLGGAGNDFVDAGSGNDTALLGAGADTFVWNPGEGSDTVDGQLGADTMQFNGANVDETMSLSASEDHAVFLRNVANIRMDMTSIETFNLAALGGADTITVNDLRGTTLRHMNVDLAASGGVGDGLADSVTVNGTNQLDRVNVSGQTGRVDVSGLHTETVISGSEVANDHLHVNTLDGNDKVNVDPTASTLIGVDVDLGLGQH